MTFRFVISSLITLAFTSALAQSNDVVDVTEPTGSTELQVDGSQIQKKSESDSEDKEQKNKRMEKLEVTGSYIKRIDTEGPSPVVSYDAEDFNVAGVDTVSDFLKESSLFSGSTDSGNRDGYFRFRGQHAGSTLILINGMRVPKLGGPDRGFYSGVEGIPTNIIERVEILKDGSSALYGSDAMAGVMNFITKKDYDGAEYSTRINIPEINKGIQQNHTLAFGKNYNNANWFVTAQYVEQRGYTDADVGNRHKDGTSVGLSSSGDWTTYNNGKREGEHFKQPCEAHSNLKDCSVDTRSLDFVREPKENIGTMASARMDLTNDISIAFIGMYNRRSRMDLGRPYTIGINKDNGDELIQVNKLGSPDLISASNGAQEAELLLRPIDEVGRREVMIVQDAYSAQARLEGYFLDTWRWDINGSYAYSLEEKDHRNGLLDKDGVTQKLYDGYNPLALGGQNIGAFSDIVVRGTEAYEASLASTRVLTTGELFDLSNVYSSGGPVSLALGLEGQWETTADAHDQNLINLNTTQVFEENQKGSRAVASMFTEFVMYPIESIELQLAGRYDQYSDFGDTINPKVSLGYRPSNKMLVRTSWGTNFNAPSLRNMMQRDIIEFERFRFGDDTDRIPTRRYRDKNLKAETGTNYNFGTVIQPNRHWTFTIDQWNFEGKDTLARVGGLDYSTLLDAMGEDGLADAGVTFQRNANGEVIGATAPMVTNMGERTIRGLDFNINFDSPVRLFGRVLKAGMGFEHTHMLVYETQRTPLSPVQNRNDLEWKNNLNFSLSTKDHSYRIAARTLAGDTGTFEQTRTHTEYDFNYSWAIPYWSGEVSFGIKNILNSRPPVPRNEDFIDFNGGFNSYAFNSLGRRYYVGYSHSF